MENVDTSLTDLDIKHDVSYHSLQRSHEIQIAPELGIILKIMLL